LQLLTDGMPMPALKADPAPAPSASAPAPMKKAMDSTMVVPRGVNLNELSEGARPPGFDTSTKGFSKKKNNTNQLFIIGAIVIVVIIGIVLIVVFAQMKK
jgi:hypothetical protein